MRLTRLGLSLRITLIALLVVGLGALWWMENEESRLRQDYLSERSSTLEMALELGALQFSQSVEQTRRDTLYLAGVPHASGLMRASLNQGVDRADQVTYAVWLRRLQDMFAAFLRAHPEYAAVRYIGVADFGRELVAAVRHGNSVEIVQQAALQPYADRDFFRAGLTLGVGRVHLASFVLDQQSKPNRALLRAVTPVFDVSGNVYGLMVLERDAGSMFELVSQGLPSSVQSYIADPQGIYLHHPEAERGTVMGDKERGIVRDFSMLAPLFGDGAARRLPLQEARGKQGNGYLMAQRVYFDSGDPSRFVVLAQWWPTDGWAGLSKPGVFGLVLLAALIVALIMLLLYFAFLPLRRMTTQIRRIADGETTLRLQEQGGEIGKLAAALNLLLERQAEKAQEQNSPSNLGPPVADVSAELNDINPDSSIRK